MGTNIPVSDEVADVLYERKARSETWDEVMRDLLDMDGAEVSQ